MFELTKTDEEYIFKKTKTSYAVINKIVDRNKFNEFLDKKYYWDRSPSE